MPEERGTDCFGQIIPKTRVFAGVSKIMVSSKKRQFVPVKILPDIVILRVLLQSKFSQ